MYLELKYHEYGNPFRNFRITRFKEKKHKLLSYSEGSGFDASVSNLFVVNEQLTYTLTVYQKTEPTLPFGRLKSVRKIGY